MARLLIHVEGQTEETFVNEVLAAHLRTKGFDSVAPRLIGNARQRTGGIKPWESARDGIINHLKEDRNCLAATMVDYYALPASWPGRTASKKLDRARKRGEYVHRALKDDVAHQMGPRFNPDRFLPLVVMHEFEGLLFTDCAAFCRGIGHPDLEKHLRKIRAAFQSPEEINDSSITAPSRRIANIVPGYQKPLSGTLGILEIGLTAIRAECPHFNAWITALEESA